MLFSRKNKQRRSEMPAFSFCEPSADGLRAWVSVLPRTDTKALANQLMRAGQELSSSDCQLPQVLTVLDILSEAISTAAGNLINQSLGGLQEIDTFRKRQAFFTLFGQIYFITGQKQLAQKPSLTCDDLYIKANEFLSQAAFASFQLYETPPAGCWQLLNSIYQYSLTNSSSEANAVKLGATYKTVAGLACASPEKLTTSQLEVLIEYMRTAVVGIRICASADTHTHFAVAIDSDQAPSRTIANEDPDQPTENVIYFDLESLRSTLASGSLSSELAAHLKASYGLPKNRAFNRIDGDGEMEICSGISAVHFYLNGEQTFEAFTDRFKDAISTKAGGLSANLSSGNGSKDVWAGAYSSNWQQAQITGESIEFQIKNSSSTNSEILREFNLQSVAICDLNPKGYRLSGNNIALRECKPGGLIGIRNPDQKHWHVCVIRWSKTEKDKKWIGVELFAPRIHPCGIKIVHSKHGTDFLPALLLPPEPSTGIDAEHNDSISLLLPKLNLNGKTAATLINAESEEQIVLGECIEQTGSYGRYLYTSRDSAYDLETKEQFVQQGYGY